MLGALLFTVCSTTHCGIAMVAQNSAAEQSRLDADDARTVAADMALQQRGFAELNA